MECPDLPPLRVTFLELTGLKGPFFHLEDGEWVQDSPALPTKARVEVAQGSRLLAQELAVGEVLSEFDVAISELTAVELWPALDWGGPANPTPEPGEGPLAASLARLAEAEEDLACGGGLIAFEGAWSAVVSALSAVYERLRWSLPADPPSRWLSERRYGPVEPLLKGLADRFPKAAELAGRAGVTFEDTWGIAAIGGACPSEWFCEDEGAGEAATGAVELARRIVSLCETWVG